MSKIHNTQIVSVLYCPFFCPFFVLTVGVDLPDKQD